MNIKIMTAALATAAIAFTPALAGPPPGHGNAGGNGGAMGGSPAGAAIDARANSMGPANASPMGIDNASPNSVLSTNPATTTVTTSSGTDIDETPPTTNPATGVSQGPANASTTGIAHANEHSVLASGAIAPGTLPQLTTNATITDTSGATVGTVSQIVTDSSGNIRLVIVTSSTGQTYRLMPSTLSVDANGNLVTSTTIGG